MVNGNFIRKLGWLGNGEREYIHICVCVSVNGGFDSFLCWIVRSEYLWIWGCYFEYMWMICNTLDSGISIVWMDITVDVPYEILENLWHTSVCPRHMSMYLQENSNHVSGIHMSVKLGMDTRPCDMGRTVMCLAPRIHFRVLRIHTIRIEQHTHVCNKHTPMYI